ncbi:MAG: hypothetical protein ABIO49_12425, partial [Dokdonella sp.]
MISSLRSGRNPDANRESGSDLGLHSFCWPFGPPAMARAIVRGSNRGSRNRQVRSSLPFGVLFLQRQRRHRIAVVLHVPR